MKDFNEIKEWYLDEFKKFESTLNGESAKPIHQLRKEAVSKFAGLNFPNTKDEEWKYTNIAPLLKHNFKPSLTQEKITEKQIIKFLFDKLEHNLLVFLNGHFDERLSRIKDLPKGVVAGSIAEAINNKSPVIEKHFGKYADFKSQIFTALGTAYIEDGAFIFVPDGKIIEDAFHILYLTTSGDDKILSQPRNLFVIGKNSQVTIIEHYSSFNGDVYFTNAVTEVFADENAVVDHIKLQEESKKAFHIGRMEVGQERNSNFCSHTISFGAELSRNDFNTKFNAEGGESMLNHSYSMFIR